jgi:hypothetical protein
MRGRCGVPACVSRSESGIFCRVMVDRPFRGRCDGVSIRNRGYIEGEVVVVVVVVVLYSCDVKNFRMAGRMLPARSICLCRYVDVDM